MYFPAGRCLKVLLSGGFGGDAPLVVSVMSSRTYCWQLLNATLRVWLLSRTIAGTAVEQPPIKGAVVSPSPKSPKSTKSVTCKGTPNPAETGKPMKWEAVITGNDPRKNFLINGNFRCY